MILSIRRTVAVFGILALANAFSPTRRMSRLSTTSLFANKAPPAPDFNPKPLPIILAGGLFLFGSSVKPKDRPFANELLSCAQKVLQTDPTMTMELGQGIETGGIYSSLRGTTRDGIEQLVLQFQIEGGNVWAQGIAYGIKQSRDDNPAALQLVSLQVSNMDASMNGTPFNIPVPTAERGSQESE